MVLSLHYYYKHLLLWVVVFFAIVACAIPAPVQEMSNARQSLQAAKAARAQVHASSQYNRAKELLDQAAKELESGEYLEARENALAAKIAANKARQMAINKQKK